MRIPRRDFPALERRRQQVARLFIGGRTTQGAIPRLLDVSRQSVMRWYQSWRAGGRAGLTTTGRTGRKPRLQSRQLAAVETALRRGPSPLASRPTSGRGRASRRSSSA